MVVQEWPPLTIVLARVALAATALWAVVAVRGLPVRRDGPALRALAGMGLLKNAIPFALIVWAQTALPSGVASILNGLTPLWSVLVAQAAGTEPATVLRLTGALIGFAGVAVMAGGDLAAGLPPMAVLAMLLATFSYGLAGQWGRRLRALGIAPVVAAAGQCTTATLILLPLVAWREPFAALPAPSLAAVGALVGLALLSTALAYLLYFRLLASAGPVNLLLVTLLIPVSACALGAAVLGEALAPRHALGLAAIAAGLALIDGRLVARLRRRFA